MPAGSGSSEVESVWLSLCAGFNLPPGMCYCIERIQVSSTSNPHNQGRSSVYIFSCGFIPLGHSRDSLHPSSLEID